MINILFLLSHTEKGGGEVVIYTLIKNLNRSEFRPFLGHVDFRKGDFINEFKKLRLDPVDFGARHLRNLPATLATVLRIINFIKRNKIDVIFTSGAHNHIYAALAKRITRLPIITYIMNYYQGRLKDNPLVMRMALRLGADYYILNSFMGMESLKKIIPAHIPARVVYHGIDKDFIYAGTSSDAQGIRRHLGLQDKDKLISVIARLQRWKGQDIFLQAASLIAKTHPEARFCLVGGALFGMEEDYPDELKRLIYKLGLANRCWLVGHQENVRDWMLASDMIVHPLRVPDAGSVVVKEAMCLGKPVVVTSYGDSFELIDNGVSGILCQPNSPEDLASKIMRLLEDENLANEIGKQAMNIALECFSAKRMAQDVESVLKQIVPKTAKKSVLFTLYISKKGGQEVAMRNVMKVMDSKNFKPIAALFYLEKKGSFPDDLQKLGVEVVTQRIGRLRNPINVLRIIYWLICLINEKNVKLVFSTGGPVHFYSRIAALLTKVPILVYETFIFKKYFWQDGPIYALNFLLSTDAYISSGRLAAESLRKSLLWKKPVHYLTHMVDLNIFDYRKSGNPLRQSLNIPLDAFVFSVVARIQEWKGQDIFIEAAIQILKESPDIYFLIFGEPTLDKDMAYLDLLEKKVKSSGFTKQIIFAGFLEESVYAYAASDVICHCSKIPEPFGLVIIEAFAMKKPVIATACGGPLESVGHGKDGYLVSPENIEGLALAMKQCLKDKNRLAAMGEHGFKKVKEIYSQQHFADGINSIISKYT